MRAVKIGNRVYSASHIVAVDRRITHIAWSVSLWVSGEPEEIMVGRGLTEALAERLVGEITAAVWPDGIEVVDLPGVDS